MASAQRQRLTVAAVLALTAAVLFVSLAPGRLNPDTAFQILEVGFGDFTNQHAPVLQALWKPFYDLGAGPGAVLLAQILTFLVGGYLVLRVGFGRVASALAIAAIAFFPPVLLMLGTVMRDTWFTALLVLTAGLAIRAVAAEPGRRVPWLLAAGWAAWLTLAARQNAAPALAPLVIAVAYLQLPAGLMVRRRLATAAVAGGLVIAAMLGSQVLAQEAVGTTDVNPEQSLYIYDLGAASVREGENLFPPEVLADRDPQAIADAWSADNVLSLVSGAAPLIPIPVSDEALGALRDAWLDELGSDPAGYLESRTRLFAKQLSLGAKPVLVADEAVVLGYEPWLPGLHGVADDYLAAFTEPGDDGFVVDLAGGPLFRVWLYLLAAIGAAAVLLRRRMPPAALVVGSLALAAVTLQVGLYFLAMAIAYRFEFPVVVIALLCVPVAAAVWVRGRRAGTEFSEGGVAELRRP